MKTVTGIFRLKVIDDKPEFFTVVSTGFKDMRTSINNLFRIPEEQLSDEMKEDVKNGFQYFRMEILGNSTDLKDGILVRIGMNTDEYHQLIPVTDYLSTVYYQTLIPGSIIKVPMGKSIFILQGLDLGPEQCGELSKALSKALHNNDHIILHLPPQRTPVNFIEIAGVTDVKIFPLNVSNLAASQIQIEMFGNPGEHPRRIKSIHQTKVMIPTDRDLKDKI